MKEFGKKVANFVQDHKQELVYLAIGVGGYMFYSKSFEYGYKCGVDCEKARNTEAMLMEVLKAQGE